LEHSFDTNRQVSAIIPAPSKLPTEMKRCLGSDVRVFAKASSRANMEPPSHHSDGLVIA
jgi:hypothetical protein